MKFFDKRFWQVLVIAVFSQLIILAITVVVGLYIGSKLDSMTELFTSMDGAMTSISTLLETDPKRIIEISDTLNTGAITLGEGVGEGSADVVDQIGNAISNFNNRN